MRPRQASNPARILAPAALVLATILFFAIVLGSNGDEGEGGTANDRAMRTEQRPTQPARRPRSPAPAAARGVYTVRTGDTLGGIAQTTGVDVERLQELNPELDPQALVSGQKIKLR